MQDLGKLLDEHVCTARCSRNTHTQSLSLDPADVASVAAELATLGGVRRLLSARGLVMLEGEPTPRFTAQEHEPKPWSVRYLQRATATGAGAGGTRSLRRGWLSRLLGGDASYPDT